MHLRLLSSIFVIATFSYASVAGSDVLPFLSKIPFFGSSEAKPGSPFYESYFQYGMNAPFLLTPGVGGKYTATSFGGSSPNPGLMMFLSGSPQMASFDSNQALTLIKDVQSVPGEGEPCETTLDKIREVAGVGMKQIAATTNQIFTRINQVISGFSGFSTSWSQQTGRTLASIIYSPLYYFLTGNTPGDLSYSTDISSPTLSTVILTMDDYLFWNPVIGWNNENASSYPVDTVPEPEPSTTKNIFSFLQLPGYGSFDPSSFVTPVNPSSTTKWLSFGTSQFDWSTIFGKSPIPDPSTIDILADLPEVEVPSSLSKYFVNGRIPDEFMIFCKYLITIVKAAHLTPHTLRVPPAIFPFFAYANVPAEVMQFIFKITTSAMDPEELPIPPEISIYFVEGKIPDQFIALIIDIMNSPVPSDFKVIMIRLVEFFDNGIVPEPIINLIKNIVFIFSGTEKLTPEDTTEGDYPPGTQITDVVLPQDVDEAIPEEQTKRTFILFLIEITPYLESPGRLPTNFQIPQQLTFIFRGDIPAPVEHFVKHFVITWGKPVPSFGISYPPDMDPEDIILPDKLKIFFSSPDQEEQFRRLLITLTVHLDEPHVNRFLVKIPRDFHLIFPDDIPPEIEKFIKFFIVTWHKPLDSDEEQPEVKSEFDEVTTENPTDTDEELSDVKSEFDEGTTENPTDTDEVTELPEDETEEEELPEEEQITPEEIIESQEEFEVSYPPETEPEDITVPEQLQVYLPTPEEQEEFRKLLIILTVKLDKPTTNRFTVRIPKPFEILFNGEIPEDVEKFLKLFIVTWHKPLDSDEEQPEVKSEIDEETTENPTDTDEELSDVKSEFDEETTENPTDTDEVTELPEDETEEEELPEEEQITPEEIIESQEEFEVSYPPETEPEDITVPEQLQVYLPTPEEQEEFRKLLIILTVKLDKPTTNRFTVRIPKPFEILFNGEIPEDVQKFLKLFIVTWHKPLDSDEEQPEVKSEFDEETTENPTDTDEELSDVKSEFDEETTENPTDTDEVTELPEDETDEEELPEEEQITPEEIIESQEEFEVSYPPETEPEDITVPEQLQVYLPTPEEQEEFRKLLIILTVKLDKPTTNRFTVRIPKTFEILFNGEIPEDVEKFLKLFIVTWHKPLDSDEEQPEVKSEFDEETTENPTDTEEVTELPEDETDEEELPEEEQITPEEIIESQEEFEVSYPPETEPEDITVPEQLQVYLPTPEEQEEFRKLLIILTVKLDKPTTNRFTVRIPKPFEILFNGEIPEDVEKFLKLFIVTWHKPLDSDEEQPEVKSEFDEETTENPTDTDEELSDVKSDFDEETTENPTDTDEVTELPEDETEEEELPEEEQITPEEIIESQEEFEVSYPPETEPEDITVPEQLQVYLPTPEEQEEFRKLLIILTVKLDKPTTNRFTVRIPKPFEILFNGEIPEDVQKFLKLFIVTWHKPLDSDEEQPEVKSEFDEETTENPTDTDEELSDVKSEFDEETTENPTDTDEVTELPEDETEEEELPVEEQITPEEIIESQEEFEVSYPPETEPEDITVPEQLQVYLPTPEEQEEFRKLLIILTVKLDKPTTNRFTVRIPKPFEILFNGEIPEDVEKFLKLFIVTWHKPLDSDEEQPEVKSEFDEETTENPTDTDEELSDVKSEFDEETTENPTDTDEVTELPEDETDEEELPEEEQITPEEIVESQEEFEVSYPPETEPEDITVPEQLQVYLPTPEEQEEFRKLLIILTVKLDKPTTNRFTVRIPKPFEILFNGEIPEDVEKFLKLFIVTWHKPLDSDEEQPEVKSEFDEETTENPTDSDEEQPEVKSEFDEETTENPADTEEVTELPEDETDEEELSEEEQITPEEIVESQEEFEVSYPPETEPEDITVPEQLQVYLPTPDEQEEFRKLLIILTVKLDKPTTNRFTVRIPKPFEILFNGEIPEDVEKFLKLFIVTWHKPLDSDEEQPEVKSEFDEETTENPTDTDEELSDVKSDFDEETTENPTDTDEELSDVKSEFDEETTENPADTEEVTELPEDETDEEELPEEEQITPEEIIESQEEFEVSYPPETEPEDITVPEQLQVYLPTPDEQEEFRKLLIILTVKLDKPTTNRFTVRIPKPFEILFNGEIPEDVEKFLKLFIVTWHKPLDSDEEQPEVKSEIDEETTENPTDTDEELSDVKSEFDEETTENPTDTDEVTELPEDETEEEELPEEEQITPEEIIESQEEFEVSYPPETEPEDITVPEQLQVYLPTPEEQEEFRKLLIILTVKLDKPTTNRFTVRIPKPFEILFNGEIPEDVEKFLKLFIVTWHKPLDSDEEQPEVKSEIDEETTENPTDTDEELSDVKSEFDEETTENPTDTDEVTELPEDETEEEELPEEEQITPEEIIESQEEFEVSYPPETEPEDITVPEQLQVYLPTPEEQEEFRKLLIILTVKLDKPTTNRFTVRIPKPFEILFNGEIPEDVEKFLKLFIVTWHKPLDSDEEQPEVKSEFDEETTENPTDTDEEQPEVKSEFDEETTENPTDTDEVTELPEDETEEEELPEEEQITPEEIIESQEEFEVSYPPETEPEDITVPEQLQVYLPTPEEQEEFRKLLIILTVKLDKPTTNRFTVRIPKPFEILFNGEIPEDVEKFLKLFIVTWHKPLDSDEEQPEVKSEFDEETTENPTDTDEELSDVKSEFDEETTENPIDTEEVTELPEDETDEEELPEEEQITPEEIIESQEEFEVSYPPETEPEDITVPEQLQVYLPTPDEQEEFRKLLIILTVKLDKPTTNRFTVRIPKPFEILFNGEIPEDVEKFLKLFIVTWHKPLDSDEEQPEVKSEINEETTENPTDTDEELSDVKSEFDEETTENPTDTDEVTELPEDETEEEELPEEEQITPEEIIESQEEFEVSYPPETEPEDITVPEQLQIYLPTPEEQEEFRKLLIILTVKLDKPTTNRFTVRIPKTFEILFNGEIPEDVEKFLKLFIVTWHKPLDSDEEQPEVKSEFDEETTENPTDTDEELSDVKSEFDEETTENPTDTDEVTELPEDETEEEELPEEEQITPEEIIESQEEFEVSYPPETEPEDITVPEQLQVYLPTPDEQEEFRKLLIILTVKLDKPTTNRFTVRIPKTFEILFNGEIPEDVEKFLKLFIVTWHKPLDSDEEQPEVKSEFDEETTENPTDTDEELSDVKSEFDEETTENPTDTDEVTELPEDETDEEELPEEEQITPEEIIESQEEFEVSYPPETEPEDITVPEQLQIYLPTPEEQEEFRKLLIILTVKLDKPTTNRFTVRIPKPFEILFNGEIPEDVEKFLKLFIVAWHKPLDSDEEQPEVKSEFDEETTENPTDTDEELSDVKSEFDEETTENPTDTDEVTELPEDETEEEELPEEEQITPEEIIESQEEFEVSYPPETEPEDITVPEQLQVYLPTPEEQEEFRKLLIILTVKLDKPTTNRFTVRIPKPFEILFNGEIPEDVEKFLKLFIVTWHKPLDSDEEQPEVKSELDEETTENPTDTDEELSDVKSEFDEEPTENPTDTEEVSELPEDETDVEELPEEEQITPEEIIESQEEFEVSYPPETDPEDITVPDKLEVFFPTPEDGEKFRKLLITLTVKLDKTNVNRFKIKIPKEFDVLFDGDVPEEVEKFLKFFIVTWHEPVDTDEENPENKSDFDEETTENPTDTEEVTELPEDETDVEELPEEEQITPEEIIESQEEFEVSYPPETDPEDITVPDKLEVFFPTPEDGEKFRKLLITLTVKLDKTNVNRFKIKIPKEFDVLFDGDVPEEVEKFLKFFIVTWHEPVDTDEENPENKSDFDEETTENPTDTEEVTELPEDETDVEELPEEEQITPEEIIESQEEFEVSYPPETDPEDITVPDKLEVYFPTPEDGEKFRKLLITLTVKLDKTSVNRFKIKIPKEFDILFDGDVPEEVEKFLKFFIVTWHEPVAIDEENPENKSDFDELPEEEQITPEEVLESEEEFEVSYPPETDPEDITVPDKLEVYFPTPEDGEKFRKLLITLTVKLDKTNVNRFKIKIPKEFDVLFDGDVPEDVEKFLKFFIVTWHEPVDEPITPEEINEIREEFQVSYPPETDPNDITVPDKLTSYLPSPEEEKNFRQLLIVLTLQLDKPNVNRFLVKIPREFKILFHGEVPEEVKKFIKFFIVTWHEPVEPTESEPEDIDLSEIEVPEELSKFFVNNRIPPQFYIFLHSLIPQLRNSEDAPAIKLPLELSRLMINGQPSKEVIEFIQKFIITWSSPEGENPSEYATSITVPPELGIYFAGNVVPDEFLTFLQDISPTGKTPINVGPNGEVDMPQTIFQFFPDGIPDGIMIFLQDCIQKWQRVKPTTTTVAPLEDIAGASPVDVPQELAQYFPGNQIPSIFITALQNLRPGGKFPVKLDPDGSFTMPNEIMKIVSSIFKGPVPKPVIMFLQTYVNDILNEDTDEEGFSIPSSVLNELPDDESQEYFISYMQELLTKRTWKLRPDNTIEFPPGLEQLFPNGTPTVIITYLTHLVKGEPIEEDEETESSDITIPQKVLRLIPDSESQQIFITYIQNLLTKKQWKLNPDNSVELPPGLEQIFPSGIPSTITIFLIELVGGQTDQEESEPDGSDITIPSNILKLFPDEDSKQFFFTYVQNLLTYKLWQIRPDNTIEFPPGLEQVFPTGTPTTIIEFLTKLVKGEPYEPEDIPGTEYIDIPENFRFFFDGGVLPEKFVRFILSLGPNGSNELKPNADGAYGIPSTIFKFFPSRELPREVSDFISHCINVWFLRTEPPPTQPNQKLFNIDIPPWMSEYFPQKVVPTEFVNYIRELASKGLDPAQIRPDGSMDLPPGLKDFFGGYVPKPVVDYVRDILMQSASITPQGTNQKYTDNMWEIKIPANVKKYFPGGAIPEDFYNFLQQLTPTGSNPGIVTNDGSVVLPPQLGMFFREVPRDIEDFLVNLVHTWDEKRKSFGFPSTPLGFPVNPELGFSTDPNLGFPIEPRLGFPGGPPLGFPTEPELGFRVDPDLGFHGDPTLGFPGEPEPELPEDPTSDSPNEQNEEPVGDPNIDSTTGSTEESVTGNPDSEGPGDSEDSIPNDPNEKDSGDAEEGVPGDSEEETPGQVVPPNSEPESPVEPTNPGAGDVPDTTQLEIESEDPEEYDENVTGTSGEDEYDENITGNSGEDGSNNPDGKAPEDSKESVPGDSEEETPGQVVPPNSEPESPVEPTNPGAGDVPDTTQLEVEPEDPEEYDENVTGNSGEDEYNENVTGNSGEDGSNDPNEKDSGDSEEGVPGDSDEETPGQVVPPNLQPGSPIEPTNPGAGDVPDTTQLEVEPEDPEEYDENVTGNSGEDEYDENITGNSGEDGSNNPDGKDPENSEESVPGDSEEENPGEDEKVPEDGDGLTPNSEETDVPDTTNSGSDSPDGGDDVTSGTPPDGSAVPKPPRTSEEDDYADDDEDDEDSDTSDPGEYDSDESESPNGENPKNPKPGNPNKGNAGQSDPNKNGDTSHLVPVINGNLGLLTPDKDGNGGNIENGKGGDGSGLQVGKGGGDGSGLLIGKGGGDGSGLQIGKGGGDGSGLQIGKGGGSGSGYEVSKGGGSGSGYEVSKGGGSGSGYEVSKGGGSGSGYEVSQGGGSGSGYEVSKGGGTASQYEIMKGGGEASSYSASKGGGGSSAWTEKVKLKDKQIDKIVTKHNKFRSEIAQGLFADGSLTSMSPATNMKTIVWEPKLVKSAAKQAQRCNGLFVNQTNVGENIYVFDSTTAIEKAPGLMADVVGLWAEELSKNPWNVETPINLIQNGLQLAWAKTDKVGCAGHLCESGLRLNVICHYNNKPDPLVVETYAPGKTCSDCGKKKCNKKTSLCE